MKNDVFTPKIDFREKVIKNDLLKERVTAKLRM
jgi:hypothetical protein